MPRNILIVNDKDNERALLAEMLGRSYAVQEAAGGRDMITVLRSRAKTISAIVLELNMSEMNGFEALRKIRDDALYRQIPVIVAARSDDETGQIRAMSLGAYCCLPKPINSELLKYTLENAINLREKAAISNTFRRDALTGLLNRKTFFETVEAMLKHKEPGYYIMACLDIENFKVINDQFGTDAGDEVLIHIGQAIDQCAQRLGGVSCRYSADNFGMLYPAEHKNSEMLEALYQTITATPGASSRIKIRLGRYLADDLSVPVSAMFDRAALAEASIKGRYDTHVAEYDDRMRLRLLNEQKIVNDMDRALRNGEFEPWYQPQFNHATGALIGAEALVRWRVGGSIVMPEEFVPVFERNGFIYEMDQCIWEQVCIHIRRWLDEGRDPLPVSVNVSRRDLFHKNFVPRFVALLGKYSIPYHLLRLEVTESAFAEATGQIVARVGELIDLGFIVEIDDFGSGYSSLNTLKDVPASILKLDMKFFENTSNAQRSGSIIESVLRMAGWLGMAVIAEGVEDKAQADYLRTVGCNYIQGYYYAMPMPVQDYERLMSGMANERPAVFSADAQARDFNFWDPRSMDALIFSRLSGAACIFELYNGKTELVRVNEQYYRELEGFAVVGQQLDRASIVRFLDDENKDILLKAMKSATEVSEPVACELCLKDAHRRLRLRATLSRIARTEDRELFHCAVSGLPLPADDARGEKSASKDRGAATQDMLRAVLNSAGNGITAVALKDQKPEFLFINDKYFEITGLSRQSYYGATAEEIFAPVHPGDRERLRDTVRELNRSHGTAEVEYRLHRPDGNLIWIRATITVTDLKGIDAPVQIAVFSDFTEEKETAEQLSFLNDSAHDILAQPDGDLAINKTLEKLLEYFAADRAYVIEIDYDRRVMNNSYEKCAPGVTSEMAGLQDVPMSVADYWLDILEQDKNVVIEDVSAIDDKNAQLRELLAGQSINRLMLSPLWRNGTLVGYAGIDNPGASAEKLDRLKALSDYIAILLNRRDLSARIDSDSRMMLALMDDTPGGFVRMKLGADGEFFPIYANKGFGELVGMDRQTLSELYKSDALAGVHPQDREEVRKAGDIMLKKGESRSARFRLKNGSGKYIWLTFYGRIAKDARGDTYLNVYYSDANTQVAEERRQKNLLDNLPCGAALYEYDGERVSVIHLNKSYWKLVEREAGDSDDIPVMDSIHPGDRQMVLQEVQAAVRQKRNIDMDVRILSGSGDYKPFHIAATVSPETRGKQLISAAFMPISEQTMSVQEMLPVALATVMSASEDLSFVKDRQLRYICCSQSVADALGLESTRDIIGRTDEDVFGKSLAAGFMERSAAVISDGRAVTGIKEDIPYKDGLRPVNTSLYPIMDASGTVIGIYGVSRDLSEERRMNFEMNTLLNVIPSGVLKYSADEKNEFEYINSSFIENLGYTQEQFRAKFHNCFNEMIYEKDRADALREIAKQEGGDIGKLEYRIEAADGRLRWFHDEGRKITDHDGKSWYYVTMMDITEQRLGQEKLRVSEELGRLAIEQSGNIITRFDLHDRTLTLPETFDPIFVLPRVLENMPTEQIELGRISPDTAGEYAEIFEGIARGQASGTGIYKQNSIKGWRWLEAKYTTVFDDDSKPVSAVITFSDITEKLEKEAVYNKWQQSMKERPWKSYSLFRSNLSKNTTYDSWEGGLLSLDMSDKTRSFADGIATYALSRVCVEDRGRFLEFLNSDTMLAEYYRNHRTDSMDYRELADDGSVHWRRVTIDLVEYPSSRDVEAYFMFEDIDEQKKTELKTLERSQTDPLTGIFNRAAFIENAEKILKTAQPGQMHALLMLDVDDFKHINDTYGHGTGDKVLIDLTQGIGSILRKEDLIGRLGGDEFFVFLRDIPDARVAADKAKSIINLNIPVEGSEAKVTVSIGIALIPRDGDDFDTLYKKVDSALYRQKQRGKNGFVFVGQ